MSCEFGTFFEAMALLWLAVKLLADRTIKLQDVHNCSFAMSRLVAG